MQAGKIDGLNPSCFVPVQTEAPKPMTVYTVRAVTSSERGSQLSSPNGAIWLCLVGMDGSSYLHRLSPVLDPELQQKQLREICEV